MVLFIIIIILLYETTVFDKKGSVTAISAQFLKPIPKPRFFR